MEKENVEIRPLLDDREKLYGPAQPFYECLGRMNDLFVEFACTHGHLKSDASPELIRMIFLKILRLSVTPSYEDNYTDINGYLELTKRIEQRTRTAANPMDL